MNADEVTGLVTRDGLELIGRKMLEFCRRSKAPAALVFIEAEPVKTAADDAARDVARVLESTFRASDVIARIGDTMFCALLTGAAAETATKAVDRLGHVVTSFNATAGRPYALHLTAGIAKAIHDPGGLAELLARPAAD